MCMCVYNDALLIKSHKAIKLYFKQGNPTQMRSLEYTYSELKNKVQISLSIAHTEGDNISNYFKPIC